MQDDLTARKHAQELRDGWQVRALIATRRRPIGMVVASMLEHSYDLHTLQVLLYTAFGVCRLRFPVLKTVGRIDKTGAVVADVWESEFKFKKDVAIFQNTADMQSQFRRLADDLKLPDDQRIEMFNVAQRWIVADRRIDPTMDPRDPEARRLVLH